MGVMVYYLMALFGFGTTTLSQHLQGIQWIFPFPSLDFLEGLPHILPYLPLAIPFALVVLIGGIDVTESAAASGDEYGTRGILLTDGLSTLLGGLCGGVVQTTPYIGHPAYKEMGGGAGYTLFTALFIGLGGILGYLGLIVDLLPEAAVAPILVFIGLEITAQAFYVTPRQHYKAVALAFLPIIADLVLIQLNGLLNHLGKSPGDLHGEVETTYHTIVLLANGFIISSLLWGASLSLIIDHRLRRAALFLGIGALLTLFGVIHSPFGDGRLFLPWHGESRSPYLLSIAYGLMASFLVLMAWLQGRRARTGSVSEGRS
jgi:AGZA family xanthine/uracil permease-like MFS transporter